MGRSAKEKPADKKKPSRRHRGPHHIFPTSRQRDNIYPQEFWPSENERHAYWHELFLNLTADEVIWVIRKYMNENGSLQEEFFSTSCSLKDSFEFGRENIRFHRDRRKAEKRQEAWRIVFGSMNGREAIEWIEREFIRKEWLSPKSS